MIKLKDILKDILLEDIIESKSVLDTLTEALPHIKKLGSKPMLTRESGGIRSGAAKITSGPWDKGKIGSAINPSSSVYNKDLGKLFKELVDKFSMKHIIYASFQYKRGLFGTEYFLIPVEDYKTIWSPKIHDIYSDAYTMIKNGTIDSFPLDSYKTTWPVDKVAEVLVDCKEYYLITTKIPIVQSSMWYTAQKQKTQVVQPTVVQPTVVQPTVVQPTVVQPTVVQPTTYNELADIIERVLQYYKRKNDNKLKTNYEKVK